MTKPIDFVFSQSGHEITLTPRTEAAQMWLYENVPPYAERMLNGSVKVLCAGADVVIATITAAGLHMID